MTLNKKAFESNVGKGENIDNQLCLCFTHRLLYHYRRILPEDFLVCWCKSL